LDYALAFFRQQLSILPPRVLSPTMSGKTLLQWLQGAGLEQLYDTFVAHDIGVERLPTLQFQDYDRMEIVEPPLRQKLFRLVQTAKREQPLHAAPPPQQPVQQLAPTQVLPRGLAQPSQLPQPAAISSRSQKPAASALPVASARQQQRYEEPAQPAPAPAPVMRNKRVSSLPMQQPQPVQQQAPPPRQPPPQQQRQAPVMAEPEYEDDDLGGDNNDVEEDEGDDDGDGSLLLDEYGGEEIPKIRVAVRKRPLNSKERDSGQVDVATLARSNAGAQQITIHEPKQKVDLTRYVESHKFAFDEVVSERGDVQQRKAYELVCRC
jgi:kinesin family protein 2/24